MKKLTVLLCCLTIFAAPFAAAQTKAPANPPANPPPARVAVEIKADPRTENCKREAVEKNLTGAARENFLTACLKR